MSAHMDTLTTRTAEALGEGFTVYDERGFLYIAHTSGAGITVHYDKIDKRRTVTDEEVSSLVERIVAKLHGAARDHRYTDKARAQAVEAVNALRVAA